MTRRQLALDLLREAGPRGVTTGEFMQAGVGSRYSARLLELRAEGHVVESARIRDGAWRYTLTRDAGQVQTQQPGEFGETEDAAAVPLLASPEPATPAAESAPGLFTLDTPARSPGLYDIEAA